MTNTMNLQVSGMSCQHCVKAVTDSVMKLDGVEKVDVSLENGSVDVSYSNPSLEAAKVAETIEDQGYDVVSTK
ncbi:copper chaperone CopZ [Metaplanococcus flavidus]|uniref:Copper chaperone CopZ n=1 Tax=Metaplanococcus flavidus TaxID=569883 RepID=A0ABW3LCH8_9BACL